MKLSELIRRNVVALVVFAGTVVVGPGWAFAVPPTQVHRSLTEITLAGVCCQDVPDETVSVTEPSAVAPVVLTWSTKYNSFGTLAVGVRLNGGGGGGGCVPQPVTGAKAQLVGTLQPSGAGATIIGFLIGKQLSIGMWGASLKLPNPECKGA
jgi:hypothetical protein